MGGKPCYFRMCVFSDYISQYIAAQNSKMHLSNLTLGAFITCSHLNLCVFYILPE